MPFPTRVISLVPSLTETLCAVGGRPRLIGCTAFCIMPGDLLKDDRVAKVGGTKTVPRERVLSLNPDLLLLNMEENTLEDIDFFKTRVPCYLDGTKTLKDGIATIRELGALIGESENAEKLGARAETELSAVLTAEAQRRGVRRKIFYAIWRDPWMTINSDTFIHQQLQTCGADNVFASRRDSRYPAVTLEDIRAAKPDMVWLPSEPYNFQEKHAEELRRELGLPGTKIELVNGDNVCWFGVRQIEGTPYTYEMLNR